MSEYKFSDAERWAVFSVHGDNCYVCRRPVDLFTMEIDHVLPESLLAKPEVLSEHLKSLGLPVAFDINSFENWLPICNGCNKAKSDKVFTPSLLIQGQLERARERAPNARHIAQEIPTQRQIARALGMLLRGVAGGATEPEVFLPLIRRFAETHPDAMALVVGERDRGKGQEQLREAVPHTTNAVLRLSPSIIATFLPNAIELEIRAGHQTRVTRHRYGNQ